MQPLLVDVGAVAAGTPSAADLALLSAPERERAERFATEQLRNRYVARRSYLRRRLATALGQEPDRIALEYEPGGKPRLASGDLGFSLSHSGDLAVVAIAQAAGVAIGVDVEQPAQRSPVGIDLDLAVARRLFAADEYEELTSGPATDRAARFLRAWTRKEAVVKALGTGVTAVMRDFVVDLGTGPQVPLEWRRTYPGPRYWYLFDVSAVAPGCVAAVAIGCDDPGLQPLVEITADG